MELEKLPSQPRRVFRRPHFRVVLFLLWLVSLGEEQNNTQFAQLLTKQVGRCRWRRWRVQAPSPTAYVTTAVQYHADVPKSRASSRLFICSPSQQKSSNLCTCLHIRYSAQQYTSVLLPAQLKKKRDPGTSSIAQKESNSRISRAQKCFHPRQARVNLMYTSSDTRGAPRATNTPHRNHHKFGLCKSKLLLCYILLPFCPVALTPLFGAGSTHLKLACLPLHLRLTRSHFFSQRQRTRCPVPCSCTPTAVYIHASQYHVLSCGSLVCD